MTNNKIDTASIAFDIDGVFADTMTLFLDIARDEYDLKNFQYSDITSYSLEECLKIDREVVESIITKLLDGNHTSPLKPIEGSPEVLTRLGRKQIEQGHIPAVLFVTARPYLGPIYDWILNFLPFDSSYIEVVATGSYEGKTDVLLEKGISHFVEDKLETCFLLKEAGITPVLFKQPWNRQNHPFAEVSNWKELESLIAF
ncbi:5' nucleotidase, NT5C type [Desulfonema magnum]|uniref:5'(3')-deoxyribonucleotidase family protein n=1 Tax=Desulfonema magnum TaxID=45655 RepID=A0A975GSG2_9BACT|nr:haloacid dehalogenase [Desulfonema magnum]QTA91048.1 5'(3')-deoxyribonucleotidase family protein [Desulfonema magnum]